MVGNAIDRTGVSIIAAAIQCMTNKETHEIVVVLDNLLFPAVCKIPIIMRKSDQDIRN
jgi:hypothetical protein